MSETRKCPVVVGLDSGSTGVKIAIVDPDTGRLIEILPYTRHHNNYENVARKLLRGLLFRYDVQSVNLTGSTGQFLHLSWPSTCRIAEVEAQATGARTLNPKVEAVIDGGGSEIKFLKIDQDGRTYDFAMNPECAAGSGNFLDVQAKRLLLEIDDDSDPTKHFPTLGLEAIRSGKTVPISGRCSVFAKSDMIHQQQKLVPIAAIVGGLHESMANNIKATVIQQRLRAFQGILLFQGGLSLNPSMRHCLAVRLGLGADRLCCHEFGYATGAIGAALGRERKPFHPSDLDCRPAQEKRHAVHPKLTDDFVQEKSEIISPTSEIAPSGPKMRAYLGIDVGSVSTNIVLVEAETERILAKYYGPTMGRPIEAMKRGLTATLEYLAAELGAEGTLEEQAAVVDRRIEVVAVSATGSGRFMTGNFLNADCIRNEITAQATGAVRLSKPLGVRIDTIFEIGGQDSKYIKLNAQGEVRDYTMNKVCAAGCGSFLEEQAEKLALSLREEFSKVALSAEHPAELGNRCTVFIESVLDNLSGLGESRENLIAGLAYSVANNYLNRVIEGRDIEGNIFFQGGTAFNRAVVLAFQKVLNKPVWVTPHNEVTGAVGAACLAGDYAQQQLVKNPDYRTPFCGMLEAINKPYQSEERLCRQCPNRCELQIVKVEETMAGPDGQLVTGRRMIFYGDRCDEMNLNQGRGRTRQPDSYNDQRNRILFAQPLKPQSPNGQRIGIPRTMSMWGEHFPLWTTLFTKLGFEVVLSGATTKTTVRQGAGASLSDYCVPIRTAHGAVQELLEQEPKVDFIFIPHLITYEKRNQQTIPYACLWTQCLPIAIGEAFDFEAKQVKLLAPICEFQRKENQQFELEKYLAKTLGVSKRQVQKGLEKGFEAMRKTRRQILELGESALKGLGPDRPAFLVIGRPYNAYDPGLSLDIASKLQRLGHPAIPMEFLPLEQLPLVADQPNMYWKSGERILSAFKYAGEHEWLIPVWITNFGCGPDSFIRKQVRHVMGERPYLEIELDEHTADAGVITRIEAFYDSYRSTHEFVRQREKERRGKNLARKFEISGREVARGQVLTICNMGDAVFALAAAFRSRGLEAVVLPRTSPESLALGKRYSSGQECVPYQTTLGDKLLFLTSDRKQYLIRPDEVRTFERELRPRDVVFYDPFAAGPCRFGQYNEGYKRIYEELGIPARMLCTGDRNNYADIFKGTWDAVRWLLLAYEGVCATDTLQKAMRIVRPVAENPEEVTGLYHRALAAVISVLERSGDSYFAIRTKQQQIEVILGHYAKAFADIQRDPLKEADIANIGMFGEIYVRNEQFINEFLIDKLEQYGIRTYLAPANEWVQYTNYEYLWDWKILERCCFDGGRFNPWQLLRRLIFGRHQIDPRFRRWLMPRRIKKHQEPFRGLNGWLEEPPIEEIIAAASNKIPFHIKGELILSWGGTLEIQHNPHLHGIVNIGPFGCMPSKVATTLLHNPDITKPVYDANYDGSVTSTRNLKIETFATQVKVFARQARGA